MKISEFINQYVCCPICGSDIDCLMYIHLSHNFLYKLDDLNKLKFIKEKEIHYRCQRIEQCKDCINMPKEFFMNDMLSLPHNKNNDYMYGESSIRFECAKGDFLSHSTEFNIFKKEQLIESSSDGFKINWNRIVYNDYKANRTTIRVLSGTNVDKSKEINLIPLDRWPIGDKNKLLQKIDKLIVLL